MTTYRLTASQLVARPVDEVFAFFAEPRNLARITPAAMSFEFLTNDFDMRPGLAIDYKLKPLGPIATGWRTEITDFDPPHSFTDIQAKGPYRSWHHHHSFTSVAGGTLVEDEVRYELPFGPLGAVGNAWLVRNELETIFRYRGRIIERVFAERQHNDAPLTVAVAGGTGFVGGAIARELYARGNNVVVISHRGDDARGGLPDGIEIRSADATKPDENLVFALAGVDRLVIALAFKYLPIEAPRKGRTFQQVDAAGTEHLVDAARTAGVKQIVYLSGAGAAPNAKRHWFRAKWRAEQAVRESGLDWTIIRPTWVYGPDDVSLNRFVGFARRLPVVPMTNFGRQPMAPVFIDDVATLAADSLRDQNALGQVFEIGGPQTMSMRQVISRALHVANLSRPIVPGPAPLIKLVALPMTLLPNPPLSPDAVDFVNQPAATDNGPLLERMPRRLTPFIEGLATYLAPESGPGEIQFDVVAKDESRVNAVDTANV